LGDEKLMKKTTTLFMAIFLILTFTSFTLAEPGNGQGVGNPKGNAYGINGKPAIENPCEPPIEIPGKPPIEKPGKPVKPDLKRNININKPNFNNTIDNNITNAPTATAGSFLNNEQNIDVNAAVSNDQTVNAPVNNEQTVNIEAPDMGAGRDFAIPANISYPGLVPYFGEGMDGHRFISISALLMYNDVWKVEDAHNMLKGFTGKKDVQIRNFISMKDVTPTNIVKFITKPSDNNLTPVAIGTVAAKNGKSISADVLAKIIVAASERGATHIQILAEGKNRSIVASGWGIGFHGTQSQLHDSENSRGSVGSGGTGYSTGKSGYEDYPWIQFFLLK
jgi:hypothetical protein